MNTLGKEYLDTVIRRVKYYKHLSEQAFDQLEEKDFYFQPSSESNSIAVIIQHISGNMLSRRTNFLTEDGEKEWRHRDEEFNIHQYSKSQIIELWNKGWNCFITALQLLKEEDLLKTIYIRNEPISVIDAVNRQVAHYPHHIGQILYVGKIIKNKDWKNLSVPKGESETYYTTQTVKDPAKKY